jgi:hypothetical protein
MNILKESVQNNSEVASLIRSNIPFIAQMISEQQLGTGGRIARFAQEIGNRVVQGAANLSQKALERKTAYQQHVSGRWELNKTAEKLGMDPGKLQNVRDDFARLGGQAPKHPGPGASSADVAKFQSDSETYRLGKSLHDRTRSERAKDPNYARSVFTLKTQDARNREQLAGRNPNWTASGSPIRLRKIGLGGLYKAAQDTEKDAKTTADALRRNRQDDVVRHRAAGRNVIRARGGDPDSFLNRLRIGLLRPRI